MFKFFLNLSLDVELRDQKDNTSLCYAVLGNKISVVKFLLDNGADIKILNSYNIKVFYIVCYKGHSEMVYFLLENGVNSGIHLLGGITPLHVASYKNHEEIVKSLLKYGANTEGKLETGENAYDIAFIERHKEIAKSILDFKLAKSIFFRISKKQNISEAEENICFPYRPDPRNNYFDNKKGKNMETKGK